MFSFGHIRTYTDSKKVNMRSKPETSSIVHRNLEAGLLQPRHAPDRGNGFPDTGTSIATDKQPTQEGQALLSPASAHQTHLPPAMAKGTRRPAATPQNVQQDLGDVGLCYAITALPAIVAIFTLVFVYKGDVGDGVTSWMLFCLFTNSITWGFTAAIISYCNCPYAKALLPFFGVVVWTLICGMFVPARIRQEISPPCMTGGNATTN